MINKKPPILSIHQAFTLFVLTALLFATSCKHDPFADNIPPGPNDTTNNGGSTCSPDTVYFAQQVLPMLQSSCAMSGCHDAVSHKEDVILTSYSSIMATGGIKVNNPQDSKIYKMIIRSDEERMPPPPASPLSSSQTATLLKWIQQGARNNSCIESVCDTTNVKYASSIKPVIQNYCQGCHSGSAPSGGIDLSTYQGVFAQASTGKLYGSISHIQGYSPMPKNGSKLSECNLAKFRIWISNGAPDN